MPEPMPEPSRDRIHDDVADHADPGLEAPGIALKPVLLTGLGIVAFVGASLAGLWLYYRSEVPGPVAQAPRAFPGPQLQQNPGGDLARFLADQRHRLQGYGWVDRDRGIARMPIGEAMRRLADRGATAYAAPVQPERWPSLGSRGGAVSALPAPRGSPGAAAASGPAGGGAP